MHTWRGVQWWPSKFSMLQEEPESVIVWYRLFNEGTASPSSNARGALVARWLTKGAAEMHRRAITSTPTAFHESCGRGEKKKKVRVTLQDHSVHQKCPQWPPLGDLGPIRPQNSMGLAPNLVITLVLFSFKLCWGGGE